MLENVIKNITNVYKSVNWSGAAYTRFSDDFDNLLLLLNKNKDDLEAFQEALILLDELKEIDSEITKYNGKLRNIELMSNEINFDQIDMIDQNKDENNINYYNTMISIKSNNRKLIYSNIINLLKRFDIACDLSLIEIDDIENSEVLYEYEKGKIYKIKLSSSLSYQVYVPNVVDPSLSVVVYDPGNGAETEINSSGNWKLFRDNFEENGYDHIVIRSLRNNTSLFYDDICQRLNLSSDNPVFVSHSGGTTSSINEYNKLVGNDNSKSGVVAIMDGYVPYELFNRTGVSQNLKDSDTVILGFVQGYGNSTGYAERYKELAKENLNMIIFYDKSEYGRTHGGVNVSLHENGVLNYITGTGTLPDNYVIIRYDPENVNADSEGFVELSYNDISTLNNVYNFFEKNK